ncbi:hypothetical protein [Bradyrhizobium sp. Gha]|uniref:hypothetical protein n=1 Tax=Bradyrhizobium sp. Gha TaxID=1855318 RepID=UPI0015A69A13|nr:hypothetical protein [Bradyrhizobium sp. Gha]
MRDPIMFCPDYRSNGTEKAITTEDAPATVTAPGCRLAHQASDEGLPAPSNRQ